MVMASSKQVLVLAVVAAVACLAPLASAMMYVVGGLQPGWRTKFNETGWPADNKKFVVGDSLMFIYNKGSHTVAQVGQDDFAACNLQGNFLGLWTSGNDLVTLYKPGKAWFICTVPGHCDGGMKLAINVQDAPGPAVPLSPWFPFPGVPGDPMTPGLAPVSSPVAAPPSAAVRNLVGGAVAVAAAAMVAAVLAF